MTNRLILGGKIYENGDIFVEGKLVVSISDYDISIHEEQKYMFRSKTFGIEPFNLKIFKGSKEREDGCHIKMSGNSLGSYQNGPLSHPGDGEFAIS